MEPDDAAQTALSALSQIASQDFQTGFSIRSAATDHPNPVGPEDGLEADAPVSPNGGHGVKCWSRKQ
jgi:hypothetical protein